MNLDSIRSINNLEFRQNIHELLSGTALPLEENLSKLPEYDSYAVVSEILEKSTRLLTTGIYSPIYEV